MLFRNLLRSYFIFTYILICFLFFFSYLCANHETFFNYLWFDCKIYQFRNVKKLNIYLFTPVEPCDSHEIAINSTQLLRSTPKTKKKHKKIERKNTNARKMFNTMHKSILPNLSGNSKNAKSKKQKGIRETIFFCC